MPAENRLRADNGDGSDKRGEQLGHGRDGQPRALNRGCGADLRRTMICCRRRAFPTRRAARERSMLTRVRTRLAISSWTITADYEQMLGPRHRLVRRSRAKRLGFASRIEFLRPAGICRRPLDLPSDGDSRAYRGLLEASRVVAGTRTPHRRSSWVHCARLQRRTPWTRPGLKTAKDAWRGAPHRSRRHAHPSRPAPCRP